MVFMVVSGRKKAAFPTALADGGEVVVLIN
jgi:hypothetical protein